MAERNGRKNFRVETARIANLRLVETRPGPRTSAAWRKKKAEEIIHRVIKAIKSI